MSNWVNGSGKNRLREMPFMFPLRFYLRALLPRSLGGQPVAVSVARCGLYDPEEVHFYLVTRAYEAEVRGDTKLGDELKALARSLKPGI